MPNSPIIVFVCEHGAAKSLLAATYFNHLALEKNLGFQAIARGTIPEAELSAVTVDGLKTDGLTPSESVPQKLSLKEVESAQKLISFCRLPTEFQQETEIEEWNDIPPISENYDKARTAILEHIYHLLDQIGLQD
jgi:arsenate reductase (thioredoxin)